MKYDRLWERLLEFLNELGTATEVAPDRIELSLETPDGSSRVLEIVMTPDDWDVTVSTIWGDFDEAAKQVEGWVLRARSEERFLVFDTYELHGSTTADLPVDPEEERLAELVRQHPEGIGAWYAYAPDGSRRAFPHMPDED